VYQKREHKRESTIERRVASQTPNQESSLLTIYVKLSASVYETTLSEDQAKGECDGAASSRVTTKAAQRIAPGGLKDLTRERSRYLNNSSGKQRNVSE
jgi:hypothetical protein